MITVPEANSSSIALAGREGASALRAGKLVGFATETVYGIAAVATNKSALARLRKLKSRPAAPFSVHVAYAEDIAKYVKHVPLQARWLVERAWPGPVTLLLETGGKLASPRLDKTPGLHKALTLKGVIGLRCPDEPVARAMLSKVKDPVVAPSANLAGEPSPHTGDDVLHTLNGKIDLLLDSGLTRFAKDSTIVRFQNQSWDILRLGVMDERMIRRSMKRKIIFICTGNTCRSPMAAGLAKKMLARELGCKVGQLRDHGVEITSAGLCAGPGSKAAPEAIQTAGAMGADISRHRGKNLTSELIKSCDMVFCMTSFHLAQAQRLAENSKSGHLKVQMLDEQQDIPDPIGGDLGVYEQTAKHIEQALRGALLEGTR